MYFQDHRDGLMVGPALPDVRHDNVRHSRTYESNTMSLKVLSVLPDSHGSYLKEGND